MVKTTMDKLVKQHILGKRKRDRKGSGREREREEREEGANLREKKGQVEQKGESQHPFHNSSAHLTAESNRGRCCNVWLCCTHTTQKVHTPANTLRPARAAEDGKGLQSM